MKDYKKKIKILSISVMILYLLFFVWALYFKFGYIDYVRECSSGLSELTTKERFLFDIIPFDFGNTHQKFLHFIINILNLLIFIPFGIILMFNENVKWKKQALICFAISLIFEVTQFFTLIGGFASDDLLMNTLGYFVSISIYNLIFKKLKDKTKYYILVVSNFILLPIVIYSFINIVPIFDEYIQIIKDFAAWKKY